jgi:hypothetical protein
MLSTKKAGGKPRFILRAQLYVDPAGVPAAERSSGRLMNVRHRRCACENPRSDRQDLV